MKATVLNYRVIIEKDQETGTNRSGFTAFCPTLGIADDGNTIEEALTNITKMIEFHLECLVAEGEKIPQPDKKEAFFTNISLSLPQNKLKYA